jgi:hypothetical protein
MARLRRIRHFDPREKALFDVGCTQTYSTATRFRHSGWSLPSRAVVPTRVARFFSASGFCTPGCPVEGSQFDFSPTQSDASSARRETLTVFTEY